MSDFMWFDEVDPVEKAQKTAKAVEAVRTELEDRGIIAFVMNADSLPEAEQRLAMREVNAAIDEVVTRHMPEDEGAKARLVSSIFKQFEAKDNHKHVTETCLTCGGTGTSDYGIRCKSCNGRGEVSNEVRSNKLAADDEKMPMKDGRPAFVSEEEAEEAEEEEDSDSDKKNEDKKSDEDEESEEESEDDEEDESEESEESKEDEEESEGKKEPKKGSTIIGVALPNCNKCYGSGTVDGAPCYCTNGWNTTQSDERADYGDAR